jgi:hypothetical protein
MASPFSSERFYGIRRGIATAAPGWHSHLTPPKVQNVPIGIPLFEEPGALEQVARLAGDWFTRHLVR